MPGQPRVAGRGPPHRGSHLVERLVRGPPPREADADPQAGPRRDAGRPVAGRDRAYVDVVGPGDPGERRVTGVPGELFLQIGQRPEDDRHAAHRVDRAVGRLGVRGDAVDLDLDPQDAHAAEQQVQAGRLEQHHGVTEHPGVAGRQRPVAGALLLDDGQEAQLTGDGAGHGPAQRRHGEQAHREAALHVARAAAAHPAAGGDRLERVTRPHRRLGRDHVDVPVQQQRR